MLQFCHFCLSPSARFTRRQVTTCNTHPPFHCVASHAPPTRCYTLLLLHAATRWPTPPSLCYTRPFTRSLTPTCSYTLLHGTACVLHAASSRPVHAATCCRTPKPRLAAQSRRLPPRAAPRRAAPPAPNRRLRPADSGLADSGPATPPPKPPLASPRAQGVGFLSGLRKGNQHGGPSHRLAPT